jgi:response regulator NasT
MTDESNTGARPVPTILVAELETIARVSLAELLRHEGYRVVEAAGSDAALNQLEREDSIKIILTDLEMPSWDSIVKHARMNLPHCFILGMVRYGALANAREAAQLGANAHLVKPLTFDAVNEWIKRCLARQSEMMR